MLMTFRAKRPPGDHPFRADQMVQASGASRVDRVVQVLRQDLALQVGPMLMTFRAKRLPGDHPFRADQVVQASGVSRVDRVRR
jgi:hypothetical protein